MSRPSHVCLSCGMDMARLRAHLDAELDAPVVQCERCGAWAARRDLQGARRRTRRAWSAVRGLVFRAFVSTVLFILLIVSVVAVGSALGLHGVSGTNPRPTAVMLTILALATGLWLTIGLAHVRPWLLLPGWFLAAGFFATLDVTVPRLLVALIGRLHVSGPFTGFDELSGRVVTLGLLFALTILTSLPGLLLRRSGPALQSLAWRSRLAKLRRARAST